MPWELYMMSTVNIYHYSSGESYIQLHLQSHHHLQASTARKDLAHNGSDPPPPTGFPPVLANSRLPEARSPENLFRDIAHGKSSNDRPSPPRITLHILHKYFRSLLSPPQPRSLFPLPATGGTHSAIILPSGHGLISHLFGPRQEQTTVPIWGIF